MAITINSDRITIGSKNIVIVPNGIMIEHGTFYAPELSTGQGRGTIGTQGSVAGYAFGGTSTPNSPLATGAQTVERFPFATDTNATQLPGVLYPDNTGIGAYRIINGAVSSSTHGYNLGGNSQPDNTTYDTLGRFPFANPWSVGSNVGVLSTYKENNPATSQNQSYGYNFGGFNNRLPGGGLSVSNIDRFPLAAETTNATLIGNLSVVTSSNSSSSSGIRAYSYGGGTPAGFNNFERFAFASEFGNTILLATVPVGTRNSTGHSSTTSGYHLGGLRGGGTNPDRMDYIYKYPFATEAISNVGTMPTTGVYAAGISSIVSGYIAGGQIDPSPGGTTNSTRILKFQFATDTTFTSIGTLVKSRRAAAGAQY